MNLKTKNENPLDDHLSSFCKTLTQEALSCFVDLDSTSLSPQKNKPALRHLIAVGGLQIDDIPMSGSLSFTQYLKASPNLQAVLGCFTVPLARVCLIKQTEREGDIAPEKVLYKNAAHPLFYHAICIRLHTTAIKQQLGLASASGDNDNDKDSESFYLLIEIAREHQVFTSPSCLMPTYQTQETLAASSFFDKKKLLRYIAEPHQDHDILSLCDSQLNILTPDQIAHYLNLINITLHPHSITSDDNKGTETEQVFLARWTALYQQFSTQYTGEWSYQSALNYFRDQVAPKIYSVLTQASLEEKAIVRQSLKIIDSQLLMFPAAPQRINRQLLKKARKLKQMSQRTLESLPTFERPIFIVSAPRAGSTLLFETLSQFKEIWSTGEENHALIEDIKGLHPRHCQYASNRLNASHVNNAIRDELLTAFSKKLINREQQHHLALLPEERPATIRFLEKTPKNALRIPFIKALFPDAIFIYLNREEKSNVSSLIDGWRSQRFIAYKNLPEFESRHWSFLLTPDWQQQHDQSIATITQKQWQSSNTCIREDLQQLPTEDWMPVYYQELISHPKKVIHDIATFAGLSLDKVINARCEDKLPVSRLTLSAPQGKKWQKHQAFL